jgi:ceramide glucosyltransferase
MASLPTAIGSLVIGLTIIAIFYNLFSLHASNLFFNKSPGDHLPPSFQPATIMVPLCGIDFDAYENYAALCRQDYSEYQIVFGVLNSEDSSVPTINRIIANFPKQDIALVVRPELIGQNFKVSNLQNMLDRVKHDRIVIVDSDIRVREDFLRSIVPLLNEEKVGLVTCLYRAASAPNMTSALEAIGITSEFQPSVLVARAIEGMRFALGATMATTRGTLESVGGFAAIADYLADDYILGHLVWKAGYQIRLSDYIVETSPGNLKFVPMMKHLIRLARGIQACRPWGYLGLVVTHGTALASLNALVSQASWSSLRLLASVLVVRVLVAWRIGVQQLGDNILRKHLWLLPVRDLLGFGIWCSALVSRRVEWRGKHFRIIRGGKIVQDA